MEWLAAVQTCVGVGDGIDVDRRASRARDPVSDGLWRLLIPCKHGGGLPGTVAMAEGPAATLGNIRVGNAFPFLTRQLTREHWYPGNKKLTVLSYLASAAFVSFRPPDSLE